MDMLARGYVLPWRALLWPCKKSMIVKSFFSLVQLFLAIIQFKINSENHYAHKDSERCP